MNWRRRWRRWQDQRTPVAARTVLDARRIFIMPNRSGSGFLLALLLMLLAAINYQNSLAYALVFLLSAVFVVAILHTYRNLSALVLSSTAAPAVFVGEQARFDLRLESTGKEHQAIAAGWSAETLQRVDIEGGHVEQVALHCPASRRGWLAAPRIRVQSTFPLGVLTAWSWVNPGQQVLVYPQPLEGQLPQFAQHEGDQHAERQVMQGQGVDDFQGLKAYHPGDSWRRMHWKAWSRGGPLLLKDFASLRGDDVCLDFLALGGDVEQRLSRLCHWVVVLSREGTPFALQLPGLHLPAASGDAHRLACLQALALFGTAR